MTGPDDETTFGADPRADVERLRQAWLRDLEAVLDGNEDVEWGSSGNGFDLTLTKEQMLTFHDRLWRMAREASAGTEAPSARRYRLHWILVPRSEVDV